jgi:molybdenum cofactor synthesis domain-containing protein
VKACIIAVGSELLTPFRVDTNSLAITERLNAIGYDIRMKAVLGDDVEELAKVLAAALGTVDLIVTTGGLGPTEDDITRDALARAFALPLEMHEPIADRIKARFAERGMTMPDRPAPGDGSAQRDRARNKTTRARPGSSGAPGWCSQVRRADEADARGHHRGLSPASGGAGFRRTIRRRTRVGRRFARSRSTRDG